MGSIKLDASALPAQDISHDAEAKARTLSFALGGEEGFKDFRLERWWNAGAIVDDSDNDVRSIQGGADAQLASVTTGVTCVGDQIDEDLLE